MGKPLTVSERFKTYGWFDFAIYATNEANKMLYPPAVVEPRACAYCSTRPACPWTPATCPVGPDEVEIYEPEREEPEELAEEEEAAN